jgi:hypothetical protein
MESYTYLLLGVSSSWPLLFVRTPVLKPPNCSPQHCRLQPALQMQLSSFVPLSALKRQSPVFLHAAHATPWLFYTTNLGYVVYAKYRLHPRSG